MRRRVEPGAPRAPIVVFGAGEVAAALAPILLALDFDVTVVGGDLPGCRAGGADARAFARDLVGHPEAHWLVMTHDHQLDRDLVEILSPRTSAWLGMIGSRAKVEKVRARLRAAGLESGVIERLSAPVGLAIGAQTPAEIAVSIAAELVRVRRGVRGPSAPLSEIPLPDRGAR